MHTSLRELTVLVLVIVSFGAYLRHRDRNFTFGTNTSVKESATQQVPQRFPEKPSYEATARLDLGQPGHRISDAIYGVCELPDEKLSEYGIGITRWGGNTSSRYNWKINADNGANDWYFKNRGTPMASRLKMPI